MTKSEASNTGWYFLFIVIGIYLIIGIFRPESIIESGVSFLNIMIKILPVFILIFAIMFLIDYLVTPEWIVKHMGKKGGIKSWAITITAGIISTGPIYMWYPLLAELKEKGIREGLIAAFLYARAVKPALIPLMILYFGIAFTIIISITTIIFSVIQGKTLEMVTGGK